MNNLINLTITMTITAFFILIIKLVFKNKMSAKIHFYIWLILFLRLILTPVLPESDISIFNSISIDKNYYERYNDINYSKIQQDLINVSIKDTAKFNNNFNFKVKDYILKLWIVGGISFFVYFIIIYLLFCKKMSNSLKCEDSELYLILKRLKIKMNIKKNINIHIYGDSPMLKGLFTPVIIIPVEFCKKDLDFIFAHELSHYKHKDILLNFIAIVVLCINWYNPIIWYSFFIFKRDLEILCDENAIKVVNNKKEYAKVLLKTALRKNKFIPITTSLQNGKKDVKKRIEFLVSFKKPKIVYKILIALIIMVLAVISLTNCKKDEIWDYNAHRLQQSINKFEENDVVSLKDLTPFKWDKIYTFVPYTSKEKIYEIVGYKWDDISETVSEGMNQIVFIKDNKVICYIYGYSSTVGYYINFGPINNTYLEINKDVLLKFKKNKNGYLLNITE